MRFGPSCQRARKALDALARISKRYSTARSSNDPVAYGLLIAFELVQGITAAMGDEIAHRYDLKSGQVDPDI